MAQGFTVPASPPRHTHCPSGCTGFVYDLSHRHQRDSLCPAGTQTTRCNGSGFPVSHVHKFTCARSTDPCTPSLDTHRTLLPHLVQDLLRAHLTLPLQTSAFGFSASSREPSRLRYGSERLLSNNATGIEVWNNILARNARASAARWFSRRPDCDPERSAQALDTPSPMLSG